MKLKIKSNYVKWGLTAFVVIILSIVFCYFIFHFALVKKAFGSFMRMLMPILFGFGIGYLLAPVLNFIERKILIPIFDKLKIKDSSKRKNVIRGIGVALTLCFLLLIIYIVIAMLVSQIVPSIRNIIDNGNTYMANVEDWMDNWIKEHPSIGSYVNNLFVQYSGKVEEWLNGSELQKIMPILRRFLVGIYNTMDVLWKFIVGLIISVYVLISKEKFVGQAKKITYALFKRETANIVVRNFSFVNKTFIGFLGGKLLDSLIIGILCFIGTSILKTPYAALVSVVVGVTNIIPFFGPFIGAIPCAILILVVDITHPLNCLYFIIFVFLLQQFDGNILGPKILGESTGITGFWVIFAITLFGGLFGVPGMIIGVPAFAVIYAGIKSVVHRALANKEMSCKTEEYVRLKYVDEEGTFHQKSK